MILPLITAGIIAGFVVVGVWGDILIGAAIEGTARLAEAASKLAAQTIRSTQRRLNRAPTERRAPAPVGQK